MNSSSQSDASEDSNQFNYKHDSKPTSEDISRDSIDEDLDFISKSAFPNKRRHVSSLTKSVFAKRILNKIEFENNPQTAALTDY